MTFEEKLDILKDMNPEAVYFVNSNFEDALIGYTEEGRPVYDYWKMVDWLKNEEEISTDDAIDWIEYDVKRVLPYTGEYGPIIVEMFDAFEE